MCFYDREALAHDDLLLFVLLAPVLVLVLELEGRSVLAALGVLSARTEVSIVGYTCLVSCLDNRRTGDLSQSVHRCPTDVT